MCACAHAHTRNKKRGYEFEREQGERHMGDSGKEEWNNVITASKSKINI